MFLIVLFCLNLEQGFIAQSPLKDAPQAQLELQPIVPLNLNRASALELSLLPGSDRHLAKALIELRKKLGRFSKLTELLQVPGVTKLLLKSWRPLVQL